MGKATGFLEYKRQDAKALPEAERIKNFNEFHESLSLKAERTGCQMYGLRRTVLSVWLQYCGYDFVFSIGEQSHN